MLFRSAKRRQFTAKMWYDNDGDEWIMVHVSAFWISFNCRVVCSCFVFMPDAFTGHLISTYLNTTFYERTSLTQKTGSIQMGGMRMLFKNQKKRLLHIHGKLLLRRI